MSKLSAAKRAQLAALEAMSDDEIDTFDIRPDSAYGSQAKQRLFHRPGNTADCPLYVDPQVLDFLEDCVASRNIRANALDNELLLKDIELIRIAD